MVETSLFPRPYFTSFLQSDDSVDPLSYHEYQRLQRLQKVARLQERRANSYEPGYKKPLVQIQPSAVHAAAVHVSVPSRQIFTKPILKTSTVEQPRHVTIPPLKKEPAPTKPFAPSQLSTSEMRKWEERFSMPPLLPAGPRKDGKAEGRGREGEGVGLKPVEKLPRALDRRFSRPVKSATTRGSQQSASTKPHLLPRPKTVVGTRDAATLTGEVTFQVPGKGKDGERQKDNPLAEGVKVVDLDGDDVIAPPTHPVESSTLAERENMALAYHWTTSTQRGYNDVDWADHVPPAVPPPTSTVEQFPDPVSQRLTFRRYNSCPEPWQVYGPEWDYVQTRFGDYQSQDPVNFCAPARHNHHLPGYTGCVPDSGAMDHLLSRLLVRRLTPRPTNISRRANIPGYMGQTHWTRTDPAHCNTPHPNPLTSARAHREIPMEDELSPFRRTAVMSKTITLVSPYNAFNKIEY